MEGGVNTDDTGQHKTSTELNSNSRDEDLYIAWIPCVSGELFFSETAHGLGMCDRLLYNTAFYSAQGEFRRRVIVSTALVSWQDTGFVTFPLKGLYRVFFVAYSE